MLFDLEMTAEDDATEVVDEAPEATDETASDDATEETDK